MMHHPLPSKKLTALFRAWMLLSMVTMFAQTSHTQSVTITVNIPYAKCLVGSNANTLQALTMTQVRSDKNKTVNPKNENLAKQTIKQKDFQSLAEKLGYKSPEVENYGYPSPPPKVVKPPFSGTLDMRSSVLPATVAILVDDRAKLTVTETDRAAGVTGPKFTETYDVNGTALWNPKSYQEFPKPLPPGRIYKLELAYENTANLTQQYQGKVDVDGVSVYVCLMPIEIVVADNQIGVIGDMVPSNKTENPEKHFVTPRKNSQSNELNQDYVTLKVQTTLSADDFKKSYKWAIASDQESSIVWDPSEPLKLKVKRTASDKIAVTIKSIADDVTVAKINVWVVWATPSATYPKKLSNKDSFSVGGFSVGKSSSFVFLFDITPNELFEGFNARRDVPKLDGTAQSLDPAITGPAIFVDEDSAVRRWDMSRRLRVKLKDKVATPSVVATDYGASRGLAVAITAKAASFPIQPDAVTHKADIEVMTFPADKWRGNDDSNSVSSADNNPYSDQDTFVPATAGESVNPKPAIGQIASYDRPGAPGLREAAGTPGSDEEVEGWLQFEEFARLELGEGKTNAKWYLICEPIKWKSIKKFKRKTFFGFYEQMRENGSTTNLGHSPGY